MADEKAPQEQKQKTTKQSAYPSEWSKYKVADESEGGLTIHNFRDAE